jgi:hypothetical protein
MSDFCAGTCSTDFFGRHGDDPTSFTAGHLGTVFRLLLLGRQFGSVQNLEASRELPGKLLRRSVIGLLPPAWTVLVLPARTLRDVP